MRYIYNGREWNELTNNWIPRGGKPCLYDFIYWLIRRDFTYLRYMYFTQWEKME